MQISDLRIALFSGNYNYTRDGANQALNRLVGSLLAKGAKVRVYSPKVANPDFEAGTPGSDTIVGGAGGDRIGGGDEDATLHPGDMLHGDGGDDPVDGGAGNDSIEGGEGNDKAYGRDGDDKIWGDDIDGLLTDEERMARDSVRAFVDERLMPGIAKHYEDGTFPTRVNREMVELEPLDPQDREYLEGVITRHVEFTGSTRGREILDRWKTESSRFVKVMPTDYKRALADLRRLEEQERDEARQQEKVHG